jgi:hypothetical protein
MMIIMNPSVANSNCRMVRNPLQEEEDHSDIEGESNETMQSKERGRSVSKAMV